MRTTSGMPEVTIAGGGLVGALLALFMARRQHRVTVLERRPDMRRESISAGRSINLAISTRGLHALEQVGLHGLALEHAIPMRGRMIHPVEGEPVFQAYGKDRSQSIHSISRAWLNKALLTAAESTGQVELRFHQRVTEWVLADGKLSVHDERTGLDSQHASHVLFGADGAGSEVRGQLERQAAFEVRTERLEHGYKELVMPARADGAHALEKHALHIWPRGSYMLIALPNEDCSFTCTLFLPFQGPVSFGSLDSPEQVVSFFEAQFPDALPLLPHLVEEFFGHPTGSMVTVKTAPWARGNTVLIGDAAHAIVPFFGQGMNCGFEDCVVLDDCLERSATWDEAFREFYRLRKPHADAIADMAVENFVEMRDSVASPRFQLEKQVEKLLLQRFPGEFLSRYALVSFSRVPYADAYSVGGVATAIVAELAREVSRAEDVDLDKASRLIRERLTPLVKERVHESAIGR